MTHWSENSKQLESVFVDIDSLYKQTISSTYKNKSDVWLMIFPSVYTGNEYPFNSEFETFLNEFVDNFDNKAVLCLLTVPYEGVLLHQLVHDTMKLQLWVSIKRKHPLVHEGFLPQKHCELLIYTKSFHSLKHTKTRIAYTYCPYCQKTTKDYGGKKHLYHEYGTLMSDVWRDIEFNNKEFPVEITTRLQDLFGIEPYRNLHIVDLSKKHSIYTLQTRTVPNRLEKNSVNKFTHYGLHHGDCLSVLKNIPPNSVDFCFADPPYNINKKYHDYSDDKDINDYFIWCDAWLSKLIRVLKPGKICAIINIPHWSIRHFQHLETISNFHAWITWEGLSLPVRQIMPSNYTILCFSKGPPDPLPGIVREENSLAEQLPLSVLKEWFCVRSSCVKNRKNEGIVDTEPVSDLWWDIHRLKHNSKRYDHPCQLPPKLMERLISLFTNKGDVVLDPFNGIGTTTLVAHLLQRNYCGIEITESYYRSASDRHTLIERGGNPFEKQNDIPKAKNSRVKRIKKQKYVVPKKTLQLEVKKISQKLGHIPSREELEQHSQFPITYYDEYFIDWGEVCAAAKTTGMSETKNTEEDGKTEKCQLKFELF